MGLTPEQHEMYLKIMIFRAEKQEGYRLHLLDRWFSIRRLTCPVIIGSFSLTSVQTKQRWMVKHEVYQFEEGIYTTPTDLARAYLAIKYPRKGRSRITTKQYQNFFGKRRNAPLFAKPANLSDAVYVDVKSAYWSILQAVGWDVDYSPGAWLKVKSSVSDFPFPGIKMARNCLVSVAASASGRMTIWTGKELIAKKSGNQFCNLMLWSIVMDVLNGLATECISAGAIYCYTDGFICDTELADTIIGIIRSWGLVGEIKRKGPAHIKGAGSYRVGDYSSKPYQLSRDRTVDKIDRTVNVGWLKKRFAYFAAKAAAGYRPAQ